MNKGSVTSKRELINKANKSMYIVIVIASVIVAASIIGIKVLWDQRSFQSKVIDAKTEARNQLEENLIAVEQLRDEFVKQEKSAVNSKVILDALPSKYDFPALVTSIEKIALISKVSLEQATGTDEADVVEQVSGQPEPYPMKVSVEVKGKYAPLKEFMNNLEKSIRPFNIDVLNLKDPEDEDGNLVLNLEITTFFQPTKSLEIRKKSITSSSSSSDTEAEVLQGADSFKPSSGVEEEE